MIMDQRFACLDRSAVDILKYVFYIYLYENNYF